MKPKYGWCEQPSNYAAETKKIMRKSRPTSRLSLAQAVDREIAILDNNAPRKRCPTCNKMLTLKRYDCEGHSWGAPPEWIWVFPKHKRRLKPHEYNGTHKFSAHKQKRSTKTVNKPARRSIRTKSGLR